MEKSLFEVAGWSEEDCILSLGCGAAWWEIKQMSENAAGEMLLLDPNKDVLNWPDIEEGLQYFENHYQTRVVTPIHIIHAEASAIPLAAASVDQVWLLNSLHEMEDLSAVLTEIDRVLKLDGCVIMEEILSGGIHEGCGKRLFKLDELIELFRGVDMRVDFQSSKDHEADYVKFVR
jgi:ubiquinone/menaquinone biosynthesis C-methylase UbiE